MRLVNLSDHIMPDRLKRLNDGLMFTRRDDCMAWRKIACIVRCEIHDPKVLVFNGLQMLVAQIPQIMSISFTRWMRYGKTPEIRKDSPCCDDTPRGNNRYITWSYIVPVLALSLNQFPE